MTPKKLLTMRDRERFDNKIKKSSNSKCWEWTCNVNNSGYGRMTTFEAGSRLAHRLSWEFTFGPIPKGLCVLHKCDNSICTNPAHLFLGTHQENMADKLKKGRQPSGESHGQSVLTKSKVLKIREMYDCGVTQKKLGLVFGVHRVTINYIVLRKTWRDV